VVPVSNNNEKPVVVKSMAFLMLFAWISLLGYSRFFKKTRLFVKMIVQTIEEMVWFFLVVLILLISFTIQYAYGNLVHDCNPG
jgi:hypothetical protein